MTTWKTISGGQYADITSVETVANLLAYSEQFDNSGWTKTNSTITANTTTSPDGTMSADTLTDNATSGVHVVTRATVATAVSGTTYTLSVYVKKGTGNYVRLAVSGTSVTFAARQFVFSTERFNISDITHVEKLADGWYRLGITATAKSNGTLTLNVGLTNATLTNYVGVGDTLFIFGGQIEANSSPSPYVKTTTAARTADALTLSTDLSWEDSGEYSHFIKYLQDDGTLSANVEVTWAGSNKVAADMTFTSTPQYLFFGWGESEIKQWTDWENALDQSSAWATQNDKSTTWMAV